MCVQETARFTTIINKYPTFRDDIINGCWKWLRGRRADDNAEGLWRVHDKLYDLKDFKKVHPGGREWLTLTEGTDITEAFESYHITNVAAQILPKYYVRDASKPRNYKFTYDDDGFYRTLKRRAAKKLATFDKSLLWKSKLILDLDVFFLFMSTIFALRVDDSTIKCVLLIIASLCMGWLNTISHNFIHQRNNWRMYASNIVLTGWRDWRVFHGLSHHLYPNTYSDFEVSAYEPLFRWIPIQQKTKLSIASSYIFHVFGYLILFHATFVTRWFGYFYAKRQRFIWDELIPLSLPLAMMLFGVPTITWSNLKRIWIMWNGIILTGSFFYSVVAVNAGHHGPTIVHEGDEFKGLDFGIYQLGTTIDRVDAKAGLFMTLTHFGDHMLHHMFPSLDHAILPHLREMFIETLIDFKEELREFTFFDALIAQFQQLKRTEIIKLD